MNLHFKNLKPYSPIKICILSDDIIIFDCIKELVFWNLKEFISESKYYKFNNVSLYDKDFFILCGSHSLTIYNKDHPEKSLSKQRFNRISLAVLPDNTIINSFTSEIEIWDPESNSITFSEESSLKKNYDLKMLSNGKVIILSSNGEIQIRY